MHTPLLTGAAVVRTRAPEYEKYVKDNVRAGGLFWRNDRGAAEVVPSEQTDSEYIIWHNAGTTTSYVFDWKYVLMYVFCIFESFRFRTSCCSFSLFEILLTLWTALELRAMMNGVIGRGAWCRWFRSSRRVHVHDRIAFESNCRICLGYVKFWARSRVDTWIQQISSKLSSFHRLFSRFLHLVKKKKKRERRIILEKWGRALRSETVSRSPNFNGFRRPWYRWFRWSERMHVSYLECKRFSFSFSFLYDS